MNTRLLISNTNRIVQQIRTIHRIPTISYNHFNNPIVNKNLQTISSLSQYTTPNNTATTRTYTSDNNNRHIFIESKNQSQRRKDYGEIETNAYRDWLHIRNKLSNGLLWDAIKDNQWYSPTPIQLETIPQMLSNRNVLISSKTGSGKTAAYLIPLLSIVDKAKANISKILSNQNEDELQEEKKMVNEKDPVALILVPSKELAIQVTKDLQQLNQYLQHRVISIVGGVGEPTQIKNLENGTDIIVATPGRLLQLIRESHVNLKQVQITVIDEFDKLFNMGFFPDTKEIFDSLPLIANRNREGMQTALFSATVIHEKYDSLITRFAPNHIMVNHNQELSAPDTVRQHFYNVGYRRKRALLMYFFRRGSNSKTSLKDKRVLVFARTQQRVENLLQAFIEQGISVLCIHADHSLAQRNETLDKFKSQPDEYKVLICTDVMTRGIHIDDLDAVVNFDVPHVSEDYLHRIGRVGRVGKEGFSLTFISKEKLVFEVGQRTVGLDENHLISNIESLIGKKVLISKVPGPWEEEQSNEEGDNIQIKVSDEELNNGDYDNSNSSHDNSTEMKRFESKEKQAVADLLIQKNILEPIKGPRTKQGLPRVKFNPNAKVKNRMMSKMIIDRKGEVHDLPSIRDFEEGRYEQVLESFDRKRAKGRGVGVKERVKKVFPPSSIMTKRQEIRNANQLKTNLDDNDNNINNEPKKQSNQGSTTKSTSTTTDHFFKRKYNFKIDNNKP